MKSAIRFLTIDRVRKIHQRMIKEFGGLSDIRDLGLLESAVRTPESTFGGEYLYDDLAAMAAAYLFHICKNHAFIDGNKRTALTTRRKRSCV